MGAVGMPMILPLSASGGAAARQGNSAASKSARIFISSILNRSIRVLRSFMPIQRRPPVLCDSLLRQQRVQVTLQQRIAIPHRPWLLLTLIDDDQGRGLRDRDRIAHVDV